MVYNTHMCLRSSGIGFVVVVLLAAGLYYLSSITQPPPAPDAISKSTADQAIAHLTSAVKSPELVTPAQPLSQPTASSGASAATATAPPTAAAKTAQSSKTPRPATIRVRFAEDDVNTMVQTNKDVAAKMRNVGVTAAAIHFFPPDIIDITAWFSVDGAQREATISGELTPDGNGGMAFHTDASKIGELPLPPGITADKLDSEADKILTMVEPVLPLSVSSVRIDNTELTLTGPKKPSSEGP